MQSRDFHDIIALIERSEKILLCTHRKPDGDAIGSIMGLYKALNLMGKEVTATCADQLPESFRFLPEIDQLHREVPGNHDFVVTLDCDKTEVDRLKYHLEDNKIHIIITPKKGRFFEKNVSCQEQNDAFDLIITVDVADISQLGKLYEDNVNLFTTVPIINIDHHVSNPGFGRVNLVDISASSTSEILYGLIREMESHFGKTLIVPETATFLLSGVTTDTSSFQNANTTPKSMEIAAHLMDAGANQQDIIKYLFRTKKLPTLKLWGRMLTKIEVDPEHRIVWSSVTQQDLKQTGTTMEDVGEIIDELLVHAPEAEMVALFKEEPDLISVSFRSKTPAANVMEVSQAFGGGGHVVAAGAKITGKSLAQVMNMVLEEMQNRQAERLGIKAKDEMKNEVKITQVLEGYTPVPEEKMVRPTLEERVGMVGTVGTVGRIVQSNPSNPSDPSSPSSPPRDIHDKAKAAIQDEQRQPADTGFKPSGAQQERPKPIPEKRFTEQRIPDFLKRQPEDKAKGEMNPPAGRAGNEEKKDQGVTVKFDQPTPKPPEVPKTSAEPTVKTVNPMGEKGTEGSERSMDMMGASMMGGGGQAGGQTTTAGSQQQTQPPKPPQPPKDPFAQGDDGLTDIERALGGL